MTRELPLTGHPDTCHVRLFCCRNVTRLPGHEGAAVMAGAPVLSSYQQAGLLTIFPLHDPEELGKLTAYWSRAKVRA